MSLLLTSEGAQEDAYARLGSAEDLSGAQGPVIVPLEILDAALQARGNRPLGLQLPNNAALEAIEPHFGALALVAIEFPGFSDGRGLSLARRLRRAGFTGTLRAVGPLIADQFAEALACGFTEIELPDESADRQPVEQWMRAKESISRHYQGGYDTGESILQMRRAARKA